MMRSMDVMVTTTTATDCVWSFLGAAGAQEAVSVGSVELPEADMGLRPDAPSTGSLCRVSMRTSLSLICLLNRKTYYIIPYTAAWRIVLLNASVSVTCKS